MGEHIVIHDAEALGRAVRGERKRQGLTQEELAFVSNTGRRFVGELESGKPTSRLDGVLRVLSALGLDLAVSSRRR